MQEVGALLSQRLGFDRRVALPVRFRLGQSGFLVRLDCDVPLQDRLLLCEVRPHGGSHAHRGRHDQGGGHRDHGAKRGSMPTRKHPHLVGDAGRSGLDGIVVQIPPDVLGQPRRGLIAAIAIFLHRLERDRLHISAQRPVDGAGPGRRLLSDHPGRFKDRRAANVIG